MQYSSKLGPYFFYDVLDSVINDLVCPVIFTRMTCHMSCHITHARD